MAGRHRTIPIFVPHCGCPQDCLFCNQKRITGQIEKMTPETAAEIISRGVYNRQEDDFLEVGFFGGSFTGIPAGEQEAFLSLAHEALLLGKIDGIRLSTRPDYINEAVLERLCRYDVTTVELGAQSMDEEVLSLCRRGHSAEQTIKAAEMLQNAGLELGLQMMLGLPGDTPEKAVKTAESFVSLKPRCVRIYPTLVIRETALADWYKKGIYEPLSVDEAVELCATVYQIFSDEKIEVIRMGLLDMAPDSIVAGPFHPAFGELVLSRVCYRDVARKIAGFSGKKILIRVHPRFVSVLIGQKRENLNRLRLEFNLEDIRILQDLTMPEGMFEILPQE